jgi:Cu/Ag efflux pump CusA
VDYGGQFESGQAAERAIGLMSLAAIFLILFQEFGKARIALLIMVNLPLALVEGLVATLFLGGC